MSRIVKLFWVDDMAAWALSLQDNLYLIAAKHDISLVIVNGVNGTDIVSQLHYDFDGIIMDYHMDPFNGDKYIDDIKMEEHLCSIPIIFYSQDNSVDLAKIVQGHHGIKTVYRPNLEEKIKELFFHTHT